MTVDPNATSDLELRVLKELTKLRERKGLSTAGLAGAHDILSLPATQDEVEHQRDPKEIRHVPTEKLLPLAAERMLHCAIRRTRMRNDYRDVLSHTLNLRGDSSYLTERRQELIRRLPETDSGYEVLEKRAYADFATRITWMTTSPCRSGAPNETLDIDEAWRLFDALRDVRKIEAVTEITTAILKHLPHGTRALTDEDFKNGVGLATLRLISSVLRNAWPPRDAPPPRRDFLLSGNSLDSFYNMAITLGFDRLVADLFGEAFGQGSAQNTFNQEVIKIEIESLRIGRDRLKDIDGEPSLEFFLRLSASLRELARTMLAIESADDWEAVLRGGGSFAMNAREH